MDVRELAQETHQRLTVAIPNPVYELDGENPWQLLVATALSAQAKDKLINQVTPPLFAKYPTPADLGAAPQEEVELMVKSTGFFRNKAKAIRKLSKAIASEHNGEVPQNLKELVALPGVAKKTANLVLGASFGIAAGIVVDTHAARVAQKMGITTKKKPEQVEKDLCEIYPQSEWIEISQRLILHGRYICTSKSPKCTSCVLVDLCSERETEVQTPWSDLAEQEQRIIETQGA